MEDDLIKVAKQIWLTDMDVTEAMVILKDNPNILNSYKLQQQVFDPERSIITKLKEQHNGI